MVWALAGEPWRCRTPSCGRHCSWEASSLPVVYCPGAVVRSLSSDWQVLFWGNFVSSACPWPTPSSPEIHDTLLQCQLVVWPASSPFACCMVYTVTYPSDHQSIRTLVCRIEDKRCSVEVYLYHIDRGLSNSLCARMWQLSIISIHHYRRRFLFK